MNRKAVVGIALSVLLLWWALRDVSAAQVMHELRQADPLLFFLSIVIATSGMAIRAMRWKVLLLPISGDVSFRSRFAATNIGFAANNLLPARVGEFARAFALGRLTGIPIPTVFASLVIERLLDGLVVVALLFVAMSLSSFPAVTQIAGVDPRVAAGVIAFISGAAGVVLFFLVVAPERSTRLAERVAAWFLPERLQRMLLDALSSFLGGLAVLRDGRLFLISVIWAFAQWIFLATSFLLAFRAFGIYEVGFAGAVFLQSLIALAVAIPSSPGFFGPFEAAAKLGLALWNVPAEKAVPFAIGFHIGGFIPVTLIGVYYAWRMGMSWRDVERSEEVVEAQIEAEDRHAAGATERARGGG